MARISTYWDYDLKKECFKVMGDVGYTKSTDTALNPVYYDGGERHIGINVDTSHIEYGMQKFLIDVVGDVNDSNVIIYDNDLPIPILINGVEHDSLSWNEDMSDVEFNVKLNYDVEHNIKARYVGNNKCLGSKSRLISFTEPMPAAYSSTLQRYDDPYIEYEPNTTISFPIKFISGKALANNENKEVEVWVGEELKGTVNIPISAQSTTGNATFTLNEGLSFGAYTVKFKFNGDEHNGATEISFDISVGWKLEILTYPSLVYNTQDISVTAKLSTLLGQGRSNADIYIDVPSHTRIGAKTDDNGECTLTIPNSYFNTSQSGTASYSVYCNFPSTTRHYLDTNYINGVAVALSSDTTLVGSGRQATITARVTGINKSIPVTFSGGLDGTYNTTNDGLVVKQYNGRGVGDVPITASITGNSNTLTIEDVLQYWNANGNSINKQYTGELQELSNGFKFGHGTSAILPQINSAWEISFNVVNAWRRMYEPTVGGSQYKEYNNAFFLFVKYVNGSVDGDSMIGGYVKANDNVKLSFDGVETYTYSINGETTAQTSSVSNYNLGLWNAGETFFQNCVNSYLTLNNLKWKRL